METYLKTFMRKLLSHMDSLNEYVNELYADESREDDLNALFGALKKEGLLTCIYADNRAYEVALTLKGKNIPASELKLSDKEELLLLIGSSEEIEKLFHRLEGDWALFEQIHDVPEYQEWIQQVIMYLQEIFDRTHDQFVWGAINSCQKHMNGTDDRKQFNEIVGKLKSIEKNVDKYYLTEEQGGSKDTMQTSIKTPKIFISHSSSDESHVELIVKLLKDMGFNQDKVFCSTIPGYGIGLGKDIYNTLLELFNEHDLYVIFVHSPNYYDSAVGLNEMGAAWVLKTRSCSILLPGFDFSDMKGVVGSSKIAIKMDGDRRTVQNLINELYNDLSDFFSTPRDTSIVWESARDEFIDKMNSTQVVIDSPLTREAEDILREAEKDDRGVVMLSNDLSGLTVQAGNTAMNKPGVRREEARMEAAVKELISKGFLTQTGKDIFQITDAGYKFLDN